MEAKLAQLEALVISMVAQVKSIAFGPRKVKDREDDQSYGLNVNQRFFCGAGFLGLVAPNETMPHMLKNH
jgi:predicted component of type VI protein secretion system